MGSWGYSSDRLMVILRSSRDVWSWFWMPTPDRLGVVNVHGEGTGARAAILQRSDAFDATAVKATLTSGAGTMVVPVTVPLSGAEWKLTELNSKPIRPSTKDRRDILLSFNEETRTFSGVSGCNALDGKFESNGRTMALALSKSMQICRVDQSNERALRAAIKDTRAYRIAGTTLELLDERGARLATFEGRAQR